jgi:hypothetical protein
MTTTVTQFDNKLGVTLKSGDTRYTVPYPASFNWREFNFITWLQSLSSVSGGENFTGATFDGTQVYLIANKTHFDTKVATATGVEITNVVLIRSIAYNLTTFNEAVANDGSITATSTITLTNGTFTGTNGQALAGAVVTNIPAGLTAVITKTSNTTAVLSFTGNAAAHEAVNSISNLTVTLGNTAFTGGNAAAVTGATKNNLVISFVDATP